jgi:hypothetical protein
VKAFKIGAYDSLWKLTLHYCVKVEVNELFGDNPTKTIVFMPSGGGEI